MPSKKNIDHSGQTFGRYVVEEPLLQHNLASLYLAHHEAEEDPVFLLMLNPTVQQDPELSERFRRRMETVAQLRHPNVASVTESVSFSANRLYAVMEFFPHELLSVRIRQLHRRGQLMPSSDAMLIVRQIASALAATHPVGLIHYDLRPENILIKEENTPVLVDLPIPTVISKDSGKQEDNFSEAIDYASPEQLQGKALSGQSNIYSLGVILYELLSGQRPRLPISEWDIFERDADVLPREIPLESVRSGLSPQTYQVVSKCLWRREWNRFETMDDLLAALDQAILAEQSVPEVQHTMPTQRRWVWPIMVMAFLLLILAAFWLLSS